MLDRIEALRTKGDHHKPSVDVVINAVHVIVDPVAEMNTSFIAEVKAHMTQREAVARASKRKRGGGIGLAGGESTSVLLQGEDVAEGAAEERPPEVIEAHPLYLEAGETTGVTIQVPLGDGMVGPARPSHMGGKAAPQLGGAGAPPAKKARGSAAPKVGGGIKMSAKIRF